MDTKELKAEAYDLIAQIEWAQMRLKQLNAEINKVMSTEPKEEPKLEVVK